MGVYPGEIGKAIGKGGTESDPYAGRESKKKKSGGTA